MALSKLKAMSAALLTACVLGLGAFAASGAGRGSGDEPGAQKVQPPVDTPPVAKPTEPSAKKPAGSVTDRDLLQGSWRVVSMTERGKTMRTYPEDPWMVEVRGSTLRMPYLEGGKAWKQREYSFTLQPAKQRPDAIEHPNTIDLYRSSAPLARGIYEFTVGLNPCASCHKPAGAELKPGETLTTYGAWELCDPGREGLLQSDYGVRLALSIDGKRPTKFGGDGVIVFNLARNKQSRWIGNPTVWEKFDTLDAELQILLAQVEHKLRNKRIDPLFGEQLRGRLEQMRWILEESRKASGIDNPTDPVAKAELAVLNARRNARRAEAEVEKAQSNVEAARLLHEKAKAELKAAGQHLAELKKPQTGTPANEGETFGVHIRTLKVAEKVIRVKATGKQTVLEGLVHAADDVAIKSDAVSVWVVRDGAVLPVDLPAILKGDAKTNHTIKPGDRLFVQAKPGK